MCKFQLLGPLLSLALKARPPLTNSNSLIQYELKMSSCLKNQTEAVVEKYENMNI